MQNIHKTTHDRPLTVSIGRSIGAGAGIAEPKVTRVRAQAVRTEERGGKLRL